MATTLRLKTHWHQPGTPKSAGQTASAIAFMVWRIARQLIDRLRAAGFDVEPGPMYFGVLRETLVFLAQVADRLAWLQLSPEGRADFTAALVRRLAGLLDENETDLLGPPPAGEAPWRDRFIDQFNTLSDHYADFGFNAQDGPDFGFSRYHGSRLEPLLPEKDRRWVLDQVMAVESPDAVALVKKAMQGVFSQERGPRRNPVLGGE
ncbi:hypothetical protein BurJ1DRAFT_3340 [Burkholderiales bacterium JOSHI_001]|nr:hypothetical protein BurJ1DRAFT_3340 [Burkholderiales bacterium JOSHI_001]